MIPVRVTLNSFKCFSGQTTYTFPTQPGLYLVQGRNEVQNSLEGNGCGKSTLFCDALTWCLFGKTPRLLKASEIINWESPSHASVLFEFILNGEHYGVLRTQSPNSLCLDHNDERKVISQDQLNDLIKIDFDNFITSVVFSQFGSMFFDLGPADKSAKLSTILNLDIWDTATEQAKKSVQQLQAALYSVKERISHTNGQLSVWEERDYNQQIKEWNEKQTIKLDALSATKALLEKELVKLKKEGLKIEESVLSFDEQFEELDELKGELTENKQILQKELEKLQTKEQENKIKLSLLDKELKKMENLDGFCTHCKQKVSKAHLEEQKTLIFKQQDALSLALTHLKSQKSIIVDQLTALTGDFKLLEETFAQINQERMQFLEKKAECKGKLASLLSQQTQNSKELQNLSTAVNPYSAEQQKQQEMLVKLREKIKEDEEKQAILTKEEFATSFWTKGFREVRLSLISDVLSQLELEVNNKLFQLGLEDWKVEFAVEGLTKAGKVKKGFTVSISTPFNVEPVSWNVWSGGETQRLRLAGALGMADLTTSKLGMNNQFEVWDEPSQYLSTQGIESMIDVLRDRARTTEKMIFLIDHRNLDSQMFDGLYTVVKSSTGIVVE